MNSTAGANSAESVSLSRLQITAGHSQWSEYDPECSRHSAAQAVYRAITEALGTTLVPDMFAALERVPAYLEAVWELFKDEVGLDALDSPSRRIVALAITTNRSGTYLISILPQAFRLSPIGALRSETMLSMIHLIQEFDSYLSEHEHSQHLKPAALGTTFQFFPQAVGQPE